jgi:hypothetical protein
VAQLFSIDCRQTAGWFTGLTIGIVGLEGSAPFYRPDGAVASELAYDPYVEES